MNLASRCRQAIAHAEMLKKELAKLQQKSESYPQKQLNDSV